MIGVRVQKRRINRCTGREIPRRHARKNPKYGAKKEFGIECLAAPKRLAGLADTNFSRQPLTIFSKVTLYVKLHAHGRYSNKFRAGINLTCLLMGDPMTMMTAMTCSNAHESRTRAKTGVKNRGHVYDFLNLPSSFLVEFTSDAVRRPLTLLPPAGDDPRTVAGLRSIHHH